MEPSFPEPVFALVLSKLKNSLEKSPRPFYVAYRYPEYESLLRECRLLTKISATEQWVVYRSDSEKVAADLHRGTRI